jgi:hypothetical protein
VVWLSIIKDICFLDELLQPCRVNLGLNEISKLKDGKKYHKQVQTSITSCGQRVSPGQQKAKAPLEGTNRQHNCMFCNRAFIQRDKMVLHMHKKHAGLFIVCKHNGRCSKIFRTDAEKSEHTLQLTNKTGKPIKCDFCCVMYFKDGKAKHLKMVKMHHKNDNLIRCRYNIFVPLTSFLR